MGPTPEPTRAPLPLQQPTNYPTVTIQAPTPGPTRAPLPIQQPIPKSTSVEQVNRTNEDALQFTILLNSSSPLQWSNQRRILVHRVLPPAIHINSSRLPWLFRLS